MTNNDPLVEEVHAIREEIAKAHGNDLRKIAKAGKVVAEKMGRELESRPPRRISAAKPAS